MIRKPSSWIQVDEAFPEIPNDVKRYTADELGLELNLARDFKKKVPHVFIVTRGAREYVVDTKGASYVRYIHRIK